MITVLYVVREVEASTGVVIQVTLVQSIVMVMVGILKIISIGLIKHGSTIEKLNGSNSIKNNKCEIDGYTTYRYQE